MKRLGLVILVAAYCVNPAPSQTADQKQATLAYLRGLQTESGGFVPGGPRAPDARRALPSLRATTSALRALKYFGGEPQEREASARFVQSCFDQATGGFKDNAGPRDRPDVTSTAVGLMAVVELKMPVKDYAEAAARYLAANAKTFEEVRIAAAGLEAVGKRPPQADAWLGQVAKLRNADGTYGRGDGAARETGSAVVIVLRLGGKVEHRDAVLQTLKAGQRADGGFGKGGEPGSDLETTYRVMRCFQMLQEKPANAGACRAFVAKCRNAGGGYAVSPGQGSSAGGTYFAAIILHWLAEK
jgi:prenyltransferase beta subunit